MCRKSTRTQWNTAKCRNRLCFGMRAHKTQRFNNAFFGLSKACTTITDRILAVPLLSSQFDFAPKNSGLEKGALGKVLIPPEVLQSAFGVLFLGGLANFRKLPANFSANLDGKFLGLVSPGFQAPPTPQNSHPKFTPKIVGIPLQLSGVIRANRFARFARIG